MASVIILPVKAGKLVYRGKTKKGNEISIRYPLSSDLKSLLSYINALSKEQTFIRFQGEQITLEEEKKYLDSQMEKIAKREAVKLFVFCGKELIGVSDITMRDKTESHLGLFGIAIAKGHRNEGIGKLLMQLVLDEAIKNLPQLKIVKLEIFEGNDIAYEMYKHFGFKEYGRLPKGVKFKGDFIDQISMYKQVREI